MVSSTRSCMCSSTVLYSLSWIFSKCPHCSYRTHSCHSMCSCLVAAFVLASRPCSATFLACQSSSVMVQTTLIATATKQCPVQNGTPSRELEVVVLNGGPLQIKLALEDVTPPNCCLHMDEMNVPTITSIQSNNGNNNSNNNSNNGNNSNSNNDGNSNSNSNNDNDSNNSNDNNDNNNNNNNNNKDNNNNDNNSNDNNDNKDNNNNDNNNNDNNDSNDNNNNNNSNSNSNSNSNRDSDNKSQTNKENTLHNRE